MVPRYHKYIFVIITQKKILPYNKTQEEGEHCAKTITGTLYTRYSKSSYNTENRSYAEQLKHYITLNALGFDNNNNPFFSQ